MLPMSQSPSPENKLYPSQKAAIDMSTGFSTDSFIFDATTRYTSRLDPWGEECFVMLVNVVINHRDVRFPLPTALSEFDGVLPRSMKLLNAAGILNLETSAFAGQLEPSEQEIQLQFDNFSKWAIEPKHAWKLSRWLEVQKRIGRLRGAIPDYIHNFWREYSSRGTIKSLAERIELTKRSQKSNLSKFSESVTTMEDQLKYAFSVMFRGLEYCTFFASDAAYFRHPLKQPLFLGQEDDQFTYANKWSWGGVIARLMESDRILKETEEVIDIIIRLREEVQSQKATWRDLDLLAEEQLSRERLETIAAEAGLPPKLKDDVIKGVKAILGAGAILSGPFAPYISVVLGLGAVGMEFFKGNVSGSVGKLQFIRGALEWPEVHQELDQMQRHSQEP